MKWIVCFCESKNIGLWKMFTKHRVGFSHVYAVNYDAKLDIWRKVEIASEGFNFETLRGEDATKLVLTMFSHKCIEFETGTIPIYIPRLMYCVSLISGFEGGYQYKRIYYMGNERYEEKPDKNRFSHCHDALQYAFLGGGEGRKVMLGPRTPTAPTTVERVSNPFARLKQRNSRLNRQRSL